MRPHYMDQDNTTDRPTIVCRSAPAGSGPERVEAFFGDPVTHTVTYEIYDGPLDRPRRAYRTTCHVRPDYRAGTMQALPAKDARAAVAAWLALPVKAAITRGSYTRAEIKP